MKNDKEYMRQYMKEWRKKNPDYSKKRYDGRAREMGYRWRYGITIADYDEMFEFQEGACAICKQPPKKNRLAVDHCHKTGKVRGLLCASCNRALAHVEEEGWVEEAIKYLAEHPVALMKARSPQEF